MRREIIVLVTLGLIGIFFVSSSPVGAEESISGMIISIHIHISPVSFMEPYWVTIKFADGRIKTFSCDVSFIPEIKINEINTIYYKSGKITRIGHKGGLEW